jgi:very-short-patch-repair endonuclease
MRPHGVQNMRASKQTVLTARALRRTMTLPEVILWQQLRRGGLARLRIRRQHPVGPYILDFYCPEAQLAIEVDGTAHDLPDRADRDERRTDWLESHGIAVLRLAAAELLRGEDAEHFLPTIVAACVERIPRPLHRASRGPPPPLRG